MSVIQKRINCFIIVATEYAAFCPEWLSLYTLKESNMELFNRQKHTTTMRNYK